MKIVFCAVLSKHCAFLTLANFFLRLLFWSIWNCLAILQFCPNFLILELLNDLPEIKGRGEGLIYREKKRNCKTA